MLPDRAKMETFRTKRYDRNHLLFTIFTDNISYCSRLDHSRYRLMKYEFLDGHIREWKVAHEVQNATAC